jgi:hypothetical protein
VLSHTLRISVAGDAGGGWATDGGCTSSIAKAEGIDELLEEGAGLRCCSCLNSSKVIGR